MSDFDDAVNEGNNEKNAREQKIRDDQARDTLKASEAIKAGSAWLRSISPILEEAHAALNKIGGSVVSVETSPVALKITVKQNTTQKVTTVEVNGDGNAEGFDYDGRRQIFGHVTSFKTTQTFKDNLLQIVKAVASGRTL